MKVYDYKEAVKEDVRRWLNENEKWKTDHADENGKWLREDNRDEIEDKLHEMLWTEDTVTGNASGSYTFSRWQAEENLCHNLNLLEEALEEFYENGKALPNILWDAEHCDVTIRCYLLNQAISEVLDEMEK